LGKLALSLRSLFDHKQPELVDSTAVAETEAILRGGSFGLIDAVKSAGFAEDRNLLVFVDQFEELFRYSEGRGLDDFSTPQREEETRTIAVQKAEAQEDAEIFVDALLTASRSENSSIFVLITMRSEYLGRCALIGGLPEA